MPKPERLPAFSFGEIMVAAPWAARILAQDTDNDKVVMLQCNSAVDEWSADRLGSVAFAAERAARAERDRVVGDAVKRAASRVRAAIRSLLTARGHPRTQS